MKAAASGQNAKLQALLANGADINFTDKATGRTALIESAIAGHADTATLLIEHPAELDRTDAALGFTALGWAAHEGHLRLVESLLAAQAAMDLTHCPFKHTPLMMAARAGHLDIVIALLKAGADVHLQSGDARNALSMAQQGGHANIVETLKKQGARLPQVPAETSIPWPAVSAEELDVDDTDPASVLRGFLLAMHRWETTATTPAKPPCDMTGQDPQLDIPWPTIGGNPAVFIKQIALTHAEMNTLGGQVAKELYLFGGCVKTGISHPKYGELRAVEYLIVEQSLDGAALIDHPLAQRKVAQRDVNFRHPAVAYKRPVSRDGLQQPQPIQFDLTDWRFPLR
ncbi:ankyrin repeat domain-containing protein [Pseudomonas sp.]|uniref:ankyrin repeat domain-containing protein n=1 Tax=Pseudomonas sp. TaxID=306 RepID=UPI0028B08688|nr:ankyrin repeat domain-containing protein [Pseudomonas sp.]